MTAPRRTCVRVRVRASVRAHVHARAHARSHEAAEVADRIDEGDRGRVEFLRLRSVMQRPQGACATHREWERQAAEHQRGDRARHLRVGGEHPHVSAINGPSDIRFLISAIGDNRRYPESSTTAPSTPALLASPTEGQGRPRKAMEGHSRQWKAMEGLPSEQGAHSAGRQEVAPQLEQPSSNAISKALNGKHLAARREATSPGEDEEHTAKERDGARGQADGPQDADAAEYARRAMTRLVAPPAHGGADEHRRHERDLRANDEGRRGGEASMRSAWLGEKCWRRRETLAAERVVAVESRAAGGRRQLQRRWLCARGQAARWQRGGGGGAAAVTVEH